MKNNLTTYVCCLLWATLLCACGSRETEEKDGEGKARPAIEAPSKVAAVTAVTLRRSDFSHEIVSNGKVTGHERADLYFPQTDAVITSVFVRNGSAVAKGARLATLDTYRLQEKLEQAERSLAKAELELKDAVIGQGYDPDAPGTVPREVMRLARLRSGYAEAEAAVSTARHDLDEAVLTAPFAGTVANLTGKPWNRPDGSKPFCTLIGQAMDVEFSMLEGELPLLAVGDRVEVRPYSSPTVYTGRVSEINPVVDENGLVSATATVSSSKGLFDGMNVRVSVLKSMGSQLVVPKSAVVLRTGKQVVFTLDEKGKRAMWNYVKTGLENLDEYTVTDGLEEGMRVIVSGNMNLAHESPVAVVNK